MEDEYSIVIPVLKLEGNPHLQSILDSLSKQAHKPKEVHLVIGDKRQGRAINFGVKQVTTRYVGTVDDDTEIDDPELFMKLIRALREDETIGMAGTGCLVPGHATPFQERAMKEIPRRYFPAQKKNIDSDMVQHPCLLMEKKLFMQIGGEDELLVRGLDPVLRQKVRDAGKRVTVIADTWIYHLIPDGLWNIIKMYYRNGRGSGFASRYYPERIMELTDGYESGDFIKNRPLWYRAARKFGGMFTALFTLKYIRLSAEIAYLFGVVKESLHPDYILKPPAIKSIETKKENKYPFELFIHRVFLKAQDG